MVVLIFFLIFLLSVNTVYAEPERIVSLAPNVTETLYYLRAGDKIKGVTDFCDWPEDVKSKTRVGGMLNPSFEKIVSLKPDMVIISKDGTPKEVYLRFKKLKMNIYVFNTRYIRELPQEIIKLGQAIAREEESIKVAREFNEEINKLRKSFNNQRALFIIWLEPLIVAGTNSHIHEIMEILGLKNIAHDVPYTFNQINIEEIIKRDPEIIFIGKGHFPEEYTKNFLSKIKHTTAVKKGQIYYITDRIYHLSPRIVEGIKEMSQIGYNLNNKIKNGKNNYSWSWQSQR